MATRLKITEDIQPLTTFRNNSVGFLKRTRCPIVLIVNGKPEAVLQDPAAYQRLLDIAAAPEEGLRQGLEDIAEGRTRPARRVFAELSSIGLHATGKRSRTESPR